MGAATAATPINQFEANSPNWVTFQDDNAGTGFPNRNRWQLNVDGLSLVMVSLRNPFKSKIWTAYRL
jgi:hypothetical protein